MTTKTPKSDALLNALYNETGHVGQHNCPERWVKLCREIEEINATLISALDDCVMVMSNDLRGLAVIQPELHKAKDALILANTRTELPPGNGGGSQPKDSNGQ